MNGQQYNIALQVFFVPYILFEVPSNIFIRRLAPSTWLCGIMLGWGASQLLRLESQVSRLASRQRSDD